jgi:hypothetical protein
MPYFTVLDIKKRHGKKVSGFQRFLAVAYSVAFAV